MDGDMRKIIRIVTVFFVILGIFSTEYHFNCIVNAKDQNLSGTPMQLEQRMSSYKEKSTDSDLINTFEKGDYVLVLSEDDEWLTIFFRGEIAFIPVMGEQLKENIVSNERVTDSSTGKLANNLVIKKSIIDLKGKTYPEVEKIEE